MELMRCAVLVMMSRGFVGGKKVTRRQQMIHATPSRNWLPHTTLYRTSALLFLGKSAHCATTPNSTHHPILKPYSEGRFWANDEGGYGQCWCTMMVESGIWRREWRHGQGMAGQVSALDVRLIGCAFRWQVLLGKRGWRREVRAFRGLFIELYLIKSNCRIHELF